MENNRIGNKLIILATGTERSGMTKRICLSHNYYKIGSGGLV